MPPARTPRLTWERSTQIITATRILILLSATSANNSACPPGKLFQGRTLPQKTRLFIGTGLPFSTR